VIGKKITEKLNKTEEQKMKNLNVTLSGTLLFICMCATTIFAQIPDPTDIPPYNLENEKQITKMLEKGEKVVATLKKAEIVRNDLLKKYGEKVITVKGEKVITTEKPVPKNELELLKPMLPVLKPDHINKVIAELQSLEKNLVNHLNKGPVNMSNQLQKQLTPQKTQKTLTRVRQQYSYVSSKDADGFYNTFDSIGGDNNR
jgi:hypothetical protein